MLGMTTTRKLLPFLLGLVLLVSACDPAVTGHARCDTRLAGQYLAIVQHGYTLDCSPPFDNVLDSGQRISGWADHDTRTVWLWPDAMTSDKVLGKVAWHEVGHLEMRGVSHPRGSEWLADAWAWCNHPVAGVSYLAPHPASCTPFR